MSKPIFEPDPETKIAQNKFAGKDTRNRIDATRWYEPDCSGGTDCDGDEPTLTDGNFAQPTASPFDQDIEKFAFRLSRDGQLQTKGVLDASGAASGDYAFTLPGPGDPMLERNFIPFSNPNNPTDQAFALRVTTTGDDTGTTPATGYVDSSTGDVYVRWAATGATSIFPWVWLQNGATTIPHNTEWPIPFEDLVYDPALVVKGDIFDWTITDAGDPGNDRFQLSSRMEGFYEVHLHTFWDQTTTNGTEDFAYFRQMLRIWNNAENSVLYENRSSADWLRDDINSTHGLSDGPGEQFNNGNLNLHDVLYDAGGSNPWKPTARQTTGVNRGLSGIALLVIFRGVTNASEWTSETV